jgi:tetratricopeptide (TPR) repeat protein
MTNRRAAVITLLLLAACIVLPASFSCGAGSSPEAGKRNEYTVIVDSNSVGTAFGPMQYQIGNTFLGQKQYTEAVKAYTAAINNGYTEIDVHINRGKAYLALGLYSGATGDASLAIDLNPLEVRAYELRGKVYLQSGEYRKSLGDYVEAVKLAPGSKDDYTGKGMAEVGLGQYDEAIADFDRAIGIDAKYADAHFQKALVEDNYRQDYGAALKDYAAVIDLKGADIPDAYNNSGKIYFKLNEYNRAIAEFSILLDMDPGYWLAYYNRGNCYAAIKQYQNAVNDYNAYLRLDIDNKFGAVQSADYLASYYKPFLEGYTR